MQQRWRIIRQDLVVTNQGVCAACPRCGETVPLVDEKGIDTCLCGTQLRLRFDASWSGEPKSA